MRRLDIILEKIMYNFEPWKKWQDILWHHDKMYEKNMKDNIKAKGEKRLRENHVVRP